MLFLGNHKQHQKERLNTSMPHTTTNTKFNCGVCSQDFALDGLRFTTVGFKLTACCANCQDQDFSVCSCCDSRMAKIYIDTYTVKGRQKINACGGCRETKFIVCNDCGNLDYKAESRKFSHRWYCGGCAAKYTECTICHGAFHANRLQDGCCGSCMKNMVRSYHTKIEQMMDDPFMRDDDGRKVFYNKGIPGHAIIPRGNRPPVMLNASKQGSERFFGIELEVEIDYNHNLTRERAAKRVYDCFPNPFILCKHDSSLKDQGRGGFEIVSAPATYKRHIKEWELFFNAFEEKGLLSSFFTDNCGMHIHVSRASLTNLQIGKIVNFITNPNNRKFIRTIAQRASNRYNNFTKTKRVCDVPFQCNKTGKRNRPAWIGEEGHHTAVNLNSNQTIEIRLFKGTLKKEAFFKNIEFVSALVDFCETGVASVCDMGDSTKFCSFVENFSSQYPYLFAFLVERGLCKPKGKLVEKKRRRRRAKKQVAAPLAPAVPPLAGEVVFFENPPLVGNLGLDIAALEQVFAPANG